MILSNGEVLVRGGTDYYAEPHLPGTDLGVVELQGLKNTRVFNPATGTWSEAGNMNFGRWYPSLVTLAHGNVFVGGGVTKLLKPVYTGKDILNSGTNVEQTETFDVATGKWRQNPKRANHSFPLFPRLHLLPDGHVYFDAGGQTFNPFGQSYDEALWNFTASYNPASQKWKYLGVPFGISADPKRPLASSGDPRTYHNSAVLLPTGQVLVGGNAPIDTGYLYSQTLPGGFSNDFRDPSFQVYNPPYLEWGVPQPTITSVADNGHPLSTSSGLDDVGYKHTLTITTPDAASIKSVVLVRNPAETHVVDGDQRNVELPFTISGNTITATAPPDGNVAPPGPYMLFINEGTAKGLIPSVSKQVFVGPQAKPVPTVPAK